MTPRQKLIELIRPIVEDQQKVTVANLHKKIQVLVGLLNIDLKTAVTKNELNDLSTIYAILDKCQRDLEEFV